MKKLTKEQKIVAIILLIVLIGAIIHVLNFKKIELEKVLDNESYLINEDSEFCSKIQFLCIEGYEPFYDETGCGCKRT